MRALLLAFIFFIPTQLFAQKEQVDLNMMARIREEGMNHSHVKDIAHHLTDVFGPRLTNSPAQRKAAAWAVQTFQDWGMVNAAQEPWGEFGYGWAPKKFSVMMKKPYLQQISAYPTAWTEGTDSEQTAEVFIIDSLNGAEKYGAKLKGKIVMVRTADDTFITSAFKPYATRLADTDLAKMADAKMPEPVGKDNASLRERVVKGRGRFTQMAGLKEMGVVAILMSTEGNRDGVIYSLGGGSFRKGTPHSLPIMSVSREDYLRMQRLIDDGIDVKLQLDITTKFYDKDLTAYNVVAEIPGTDPVLKNELVMIGAHLDSWQNATGATDNAAGCIATMEAVRILKALGVHPRRTIRIALWTGEEQGILGSHYYVKKHFGDAATMSLTPDHKKISAYYNLDNGSGKIRGIFLQGNKAVDTIFKQWMAPFADLGATATTISNTGSTDHIPFDEVGIPAFQFIQDPLEYGNHTHHSNLDNYDHLFLPDLQQAAIVMAAFVYNTAMRDQQMPRKPLPDPAVFPFEW